MSKARDLSKLPIGLTSNDSGFIGIGAPNPQVSLDAQKSGDVQIRARETSLGVDTRMLAVGGTSQAGVLGTYSNHPLVINTNGVEAFRIPSNAGGIQFLTAQRASSDPNTLDDYEEGTFTPTFLINGVSQSGNGAGSYTKIGRCVTFTITFYNDTWTRSGSGTVQVGGLPFAGANVSGGAGGGSYSGYKFILPVNTWLNVATSTTGTIYGGAGPINSSALAAGTFLFEQLCGVYFTS